MGMSNRVVLVGPNSLLTIGFMPTCDQLKPERLFYQYGWDWNGYAKFVFVRNPWARLVSLYHHIAQKQSPPPFMDWLYTIQPYGRGGGGERYPRDSWQRFGTYSIEYFIKDEEGNILVDKVIRLEDINHELLPFLNALKVPISSDCYHSP